MNTKKMKIENLVFEGGGTKGSAFAGCVSVLDEMNILTDVKRVAGTSAGSITAALLACGAGSDGLMYSVTHSNFKQFVSDKGWIFGDIYRMVTKYGIHTGNAFVKILKDFIEQYAGNSELTFAELDILVQQKPLVYKQLTVVSSNLTRQNPEIFNSTNTPNLPIWMAVRASMSIPLIFEPLQIDGSYFNPKRKEKDSFVDGGLCSIFPIDVYDTTILENPTGDEIYERNPATLGFYLEQKALVPDGEKYNPPIIKYNSIKSFAMTMFLFLSKNANSKHLHPDDKSRTVFIDDLGVSGTDFNTSKKMINALIESGKKATQDYFKLRN